jgi:hypothetical protein
MVVEFAWSAKGPDNISKFFWVTLDMHFRRLYYLYLINVNFKRRV